jgi:hypothetical protein
MPKRFRPSAALVVAGEARIVAIGPTRGCGVQTARGVGAPFRAKAARRVIATTSRRSGKRYLRR